MNNKRVWYAPSIPTKSVDTIHQVLMHGTLEEIKALKKELGEKIIKEFFLNHPKKIYTAPALNFIKNFILKLSTPIDEQQYLKNTPRHIR